MKILDRIFARKEEELEQALRMVSTAEMRMRAHDAAPPRGFLAALKASNRKPALIAEVKKASPSEGVIRENFDPAAIAQTYEQAGATCLSVLTDVDFFQGSNANLSKCRSACELHILRKDFTIHDHQIYEARAIGADAILLIAAMIDPSRLADLHGTAKSIGLDVLVEVHDEAEAEEALALGADLIGVNNRDLSTFKTDLAITARLAPIITPHAFLVSESALKTQADVREAASAGAGAVLIGTTFCAADDIGAKVREVMG
jgi:indole-3-glycerol phosphate synthase